MVWWDWNTMKKTWTCASISSSNVTGLEAILITNHTCSLCIYVSFFSCFFFLFSMDTLVHFPLFWVYKTFTMSSELLWVCTFTSWFCHYVVWTFMSFAHSLVGFLCHLFVSLHLSQFLIFSVSSKTIYFIKIWEFIIICSVGKNSKRVIFERMSQVIF